MNASVIVPVERGRDDVMHVTWIERIAFGLAAVTDLADPRPVRRRVEPARLRPAHEAIGSEALRLRVQRQLGSIAH